MSRRAGRALLMTLQWLAVTLAYASVVAHSATALQAFVRPHLGATPGADPRKIPGRAPGATFRRRESLGQPYRDLSCLRARAVLYPSCLQ